MVGVVVILLAGCPGPEPESEVGPPPLDASVIAQIDPHTIQAHVDVLADEALGGRIPGSIGAAQARDYIIGEMIEVGLEPLGRDGTFLHDYPNAPEEWGLMRDESGEVVVQETQTGFNLVGLIPGTDSVLSDEYIVVMAHYDHLGVDDDNAAFNGAFDNAVAVGMSLELARVLIETGSQPARSLIFLFTDDEEFGLDGADAWILDPTVDKDAIVFGVSTDPLGRRLVPDFGPIALIGLERTPKLEKVWREAASFVDAPVYFINRDVVPIFASDQDRFFAADTPALWFANMGFSWYHTTGDDSETIDYRMVLDDAELLAYALTLAGNDSARYPYRGPVVPAGDAAAGALALFEDLLNSSHLDAGDRLIAEGHMEQLEAIVLADNSDAVDNVEVLYIAALYFLLFDLPYKYPGDIPPPWPESALP